MNFVSLFESAVLHYPNNTAAFFEGSQCSYQHLNERANAFAQALESLGVEPQDKVMITAFNSIDYLEVLLGCMKIKAIACLLNARLSSQEIEQIAQQDIPRIFIFEEATQSHAKHLQEKFSDTCITYISLDGTFDGIDCLEYRALVDKESTEFKTVLAQQNHDVAIQLYTSGTTGLPKGVCHSHERLTFFMAMFGYTLRNYPTDMPQPQNETFLCTLPLYHVSGFTVLYALSSGGRLVLQKRFKVKDFLATVETFKITRTTVPQTVLEWMVNCGELGMYDLSSLVSISYGGAPIKRSTVDQITSKIHCSITQAYGSTECLIATILLGADHLVDPNTGDMRAYSVGRPMIGAEVKIVDPQGKMCATGKEGEVLVKSPVLMLEYHGMSSEESGIDAGGWFRTKDIGYLDENGFLYLSGRMNDLIISGGENIYPQEIENCIYRLGSDIANVAIVGIPHQKWGECPVAFVVRKPGSLLTEADIIQHCESHIARYKRPKKVHFIEEIPLDPLGKISRKKLRQMAVEMLDAE